MPGTRARAKAEERGDAERGRIGAELAEQRLVGRAADAGLGHQHAGGGRDDQRRDLGDQAVADGQQREGVRRLAEGEAMSARRR